MKRNTIFFIILCAVLIWGWAAASGSSAAQKEQGTLLGEKHKGKGVDCSGCHQESPPAKPVPSAACMKCHGDQAKLAQRTAKVTPNPHASPHLNPGDQLVCEDCHHVHKPSENACNKCHEFKFKTP